METPAWGKLRQMDPWDSMGSQPSLPGELQTNERRSLKTRGRRLLRNDIPCSPLSSTYAPPTGNCTHMNIQMHVHTGKRKAKSLKSSLSTAATEEEW